MTRIRCWLTTPGLACIALLTLLLTSCALPEGSLELGIATLVAEQVVVQEVPTAVAEADDAPAEVTGESKATEQTAAAESAQVAAPVEEAAAGGTESPDSEPVSAGVDATAEPQATQFPEATAALEPATPAPTAYLEVSHYDPARACNGTTYLVDAHDPQRPRIIEVSMEGEALWEYEVLAEPEASPEWGIDIEVHDGPEQAIGGVAIQVVLPHQGVLILDKGGQTLSWLEDELVRYDADRLSNGNTLYTVTEQDGMVGPQVKEVSSEGAPVWQWTASEHLAVLPGWSPANDVRRLWNGNTVINLGDEALTVEVDREGELVWQFDWATLYPDLPGLDLVSVAPEMQGHDQMLVCFQGDAPHQAVEIERANGTMVWHYHREGLGQVSDCDRVCGGNVLLVGVLTETQESVISEVTWDGDIVWQLVLKDAPTGDGPGWFYKAQRVY